MLTNFLWQTVNGGDLSKDVFASDDETALLTDNEDELADRLLSQFPAYGTNVKPVGFHAQDDNDDDDDVFQLGSTNNTTTTQVKKESSLLLRVKDSGWDDEEDGLWKNGQESSLVVVPKKEWTKHSSSSLSSTAEEKEEANTMNKTKSSFYEWNDSQRRAWVDGGGTNNNNNKQPMANNNAAPTKEPITSPVLSRYLPSSSFGKQPSTDDSFKNDDRQHWMPDKLCKQCYACDVPFTVFRRRHHCRLCGQVFCSNCSAYFVELDEFEENKTMRACKMCFEGTLLMPLKSHHSNTVMMNHPKSNHGEKQQRDGRGVNLVATTGEQTTTAPSTSSSSPPQQGNKSLLVVDQKMDASSGVLSGLAQKQRTTEEINKPLANQNQSTAANNRKAKQLLRNGKQEQLTPDNDGQQQQKDGGVVPPFKNKSKEALESQKKLLLTTTVNAANRKLGLTAASHLELLGKELLKSDVPLLLKEHPHKQSQWINTLMTLATRCCATVNPNVKKGDLLDLRPYCKVKVIAGGSHRDCAYMSGIVFRKNVSHKRMAKEISNPRIMLLSGGIEFTRTENQIASLDTLLEQEEKYMEILVGKILKLNPHVLLVGKSVSRKAQELLLRARVVLIQHVKSTLMSRISRQTGATIISSTDHVMNQFDASVLGNCRRFRLVTFRDNETWVDDIRSLPEKRSKSHQKNQTRVIEYLLADQSLSNHERQAALAANELGESVLDGTEAVKRGLAKRGVAQTYIMLEGCPKHLGCTVVLRGASRAALKQVKRVFRFLVNVAYNLKLETSYLRERCAKLPESFQVKPRQLYSSSLCVDYGGPPSGRKVRPWNGRNSEATQRLGKITAFDHQSILITSVWMTGTTQCCPAEVKGICYYSLQDVSLGQFLRDSCFNLSLKCQNSTCKKSVLDHSLSFIHNDGLINITVEHMDDPLPPSPLEGTGNSSQSKSDDEEADDSGNPEVDSPIATWTYCINCGKVVTPLVYISEETWKFSFGKFLESVFYNRDAVMNAPEHGCSCQMQSAGTLYFGCGRLAARFTYERVRPFGVFVRRNLPIDDSFHRSEALLHLEKISLSSSDLFARFDKHIEKVSREARSLLGSAANRPEHLQTVLAELSSIGLEVDHAAKTLQDKIASVSDKCRESVSSSKDGTGIVNEALFRFPWFSRRYLFMLTSAWNERLSAIGQALGAMKKLAAAAQRGDIVISPNVVPGIVGDGPDDLTDCMRRIRELNEVYSQYNVTDITTVLPTLVGSGGPNPVEYDDDWDPEGAIDFADGVDADVLASRRRLYNSKPMNSLESQSDRGSEGRPRKSLGTPATQHQESGRQRNSSRGTRESSPIPSVQSSQAITKSKTVTPGGAVKSAFNRFFNRGGKELDPYVVDLGIFNEGRPRLEVGVGGVVVPVMDDLPSTVVAYSLSSAEYAQQFEQFSKADGVSSGDKQTQTASNRPGDDAPGGAEPLTAQPPRHTRTRAPSPSLQRSRNGHNEKRAPSPLSNPGPSSTSDDRKDIERRILFRNKSHIKHTFRDFDEKGQQTCKFVCTAYWATQFHAVRQAFLAAKEPSSGSQGRSASPSPQLNDVEKCYVQSLSSAFPWAASGGKSGASFARTADERFVIKCISRTELQMFLDCAPAYFEYLSKAFFHGLPTVLCKIVGVYQIGYHDRVSGKRSMEQVAVMQNIFYGRKISKIFDLKGSLRGRLAKDKVAADALTQSALARVGSDSELSDRPQQVGEDENTASSSTVNQEEDDSAQGGRRNSSEQAASAPSATLLDGDFLEFTNGRPLPLTDRAKAVFHMSVLNDTLFLSIINVLDYSILVGIDEEKMDLVVGIIDFMRQYDILKQMERVGKSLPMVVGSEAPTIIQPPLYKARFTNAMERYFMTVPNKWTVI